MSIKNHKITVKQNFCAEVEFTTTLFSRSDAACYQPEHVKHVLNAWRDITGLNFDKMPRVDRSAEPGNEGYRVIVVENPIDNRSKVTFVWEI